MTEDARLKLNTADTELICMWITFKHEQKKTAFRKRESVNNYIPISYTAYNLHPPPFSLFYRLLKDVLSKQTPNKLLKILQDVLGGELLYRNVKYVF